MKVIFRWFDPKTQKLHKLHKEMLAEEFGLLRPQVYLVLNGASVPHRLVVHAVELGIDLTPACKVAQGVVHCDVVMA